MDISEKIENSEEENLDKKGDPDSVITIFLNILNIKEILKTFFNLIRIKTSEAFISGVILIIFLCFIYRYTPESTNNQIFSFSFPPSWPMTIFWILVIFVAVDLLASNVKSIKKYLFTEEKNKIFLENIKSYPARKIKDEIGMRRMSSTNINYYLDLVKNDPTFGNAFILEDILRTRNLTVENFNKIFIPEILRFLNESSIINLLLNNPNKLSAENVQILYDFFKTNDRIIKMIFATQNQAEIIIRSDLNLKSRYDLFQAKVPEKLEELKFALEEKLQKNLENYVIPVLIITIILAYFIDILLEMILFKESIITTPDTYIVAIGFVSLVLGTLIVGSVFYFYVNHFFNSIRKKKNSIANLIDQME